MPAPASPTARRHAPSLVLLALALALALLLVGCGGAETSQPARAESQGTTEEPTTVEDAPSTPAEPAPDPGFGAPKVGACYKMGAAQSVASVASGRKVSCTKRHSSVVAYVGFLPRAVSAATPVPRRKALGKRWCAPAYRELAGGTPADRAASLLTWTLFTPAQSQLERGARWIRCDVVARSGAGLVPLPAPTPLLGNGVPESLRICQSAAGRDVSCAQPHAFRVQAVYRAGNKAYPDPEAYTRTARARCRQLMGSYGGYFQPPSPAGWKAGDRFIRCLSPAGAETEPATP